MLDRIDPSILVILRQGKKLQVAERAEHGLGADSEIPFDQQDILIRQAAGSGLPLGELPDLGWRHEELGGKLLGELLLFIKGGSANPGARPFEIAEDFRSGDTGDFIPVLEVMAVFMGGGEYLTARRLGRIDQGEGRALGLEKNEYPRDLDIGRKRPAQDPQPVALEERENVPDGLIAETKAATFLGGHPFGREAACIKGGDSRRRPVAFSRRK